MAALKATSKKQDNTLSNIVTWAMVKDSREAQECVGAMVKILEKLVWEREPANFLLGLVEWRIFTSNASSRSGMAETISSRMAKAVTISPIKRFNQTFSTKLFGIYSISRRA